MGLIGSPCNRHLERFGDSLGFLCLHRNRIRDIEKLSAERRPIKIEAASLKQLVHGQLRPLVSVTELFNKSAHPDWVYYAQSSVKLWAHCA